MAKRSLRNKAGKQVEALTHAEAKRKNIPTAEHQSVMAKEAQDPIRVAYERRNRDLDPQLVWRGKDEQDWSDLVVQAPPLYIQEKVHPKVLIDDLLRRSMQQRAETAGAQTDLFADFNGIPEGVDKTEFYRHDQNWSNRMILGDSLQVMASLAEREGLRGRVQCIYFDPPYGIKFNSNFQWSTTSRDVKDGNTGHITREPEQVRAFRDTWRDGIHSYLTYLRDRLTVARDLLTDSGSIFVQIGDENVHRVRAVMDEVFGDKNLICQIVYQTTPYATSDYLAPVCDVILWYAKDYPNVKYRPLYKDKSDLQSFSRFSTLVSPDRAVTRPRTREEAESDSVPEGWRLFQPVSLVSPGPTSSDQEFVVAGRAFYPASNSHWKTRVEGLVRAGKAGRIHLTSTGVRFRSFIDDFSISVTHNIWTDTGGGISSRTDEKRYVVQTSPTVIQRCILMATDPGDLVLDPTCGSGTTATVAEQWGRRWITIDTSRVALALARARIMGARYPFYLLADSPEGKAKEAALRGVAGVGVASDQWLLVAGEKGTGHKPLTTSHNSLRQGFVYERVPHITLKSIANNAEIDVIWERYEQKLEPLRGELSVACGLKKTLQEWEIPREAPPHWPPATQPLLTAWWEARIARQKEIDASIAAKAEFEYLYDKPYEDKKTVRVAGPFTVESLSPHRVLGVDEDDELIDTAGEGAGDYGRPQDFATMILENLRTAGVQQAHKEDRIVFTALTPWPGAYICAEGRFEGSEKWLVASGGKGEDGKSKQSTSHQSLSTKHYLRAGIFIGPEFGTVSRPDLVAAAREAGDAGFDVLIACAFSYDARSCDFDRLGSVPVLKARMNADLHMAEDLKNTGKGNLFVIFGEPDIDILTESDGEIRVRVNGVDVFHPQTGEVRSDGPEGIACWFIDTDYNEESFFVRHAYFLGQNDPYKSLKTTLKAEIDEEAWESLHSDTSRPFDKPANGRIAVKVINHLGDEVMKVFRV